tara:strand:- start:493 stop:756 length:264 start_codon:yes stop_codon:yes gene_type:complete
MPRHILVKERINKLAKELKLFTTDEIFERINNYPNNKGILYADRRRVTKNKLTAFLRMDKDIAINIPHQKNNSDTRTVWEYIGDEEE